MPHDTVLESLIPHLKGWWGAITALLCLAGFAIVVCTTVGIARGGGRQSKWGAVFFAAVAGILLVNLPGFLDSLAQTLFGHGSVQGLDYEPPQHPARHYVQFAIHMLALVGLVGVGRGILLLKDSANKPGQLGMALTHIFGGTLCLNFTETLRLIGRSLGSDAMGVITAIVG
jgi:hypothetical protein